MIGHRLHLSRCAAGLSLRQLQSRIDDRVSAQAISKYEHDKSMPSSAVLIALADVLDVSVHYLAGRSDFALDSIEFPKKRFTSMRQAARVEAQVLHLLERYLTIEEILRLPSIAWDKPREAPYSVLQDISEAEPSAMGLRIHWRLGADPIPNLVEILEERGIKVLSTALGNIDSLATRAQCASGETEAAVVVVNQDSCGERQRFTIAHELGRMLLDVAPKLNEDKAAQRFAGALLMPAESLRSEVGKHRKSIGLGELLELKRIFGVSVQAFTYRCRDLGIFSDTLFRTLLEKFSQCGWRSPPYKEPHGLTAERPGRFERLCFRALAESAISESKAAELLGISVHDLNRLVNDPLVPKTAVA